MIVADKICIITGSAQGLGKAFAVRLLENGAKTCLSDVNECTGKATFKELEEKFGVGRVCFKTCDVTKEEEFNNLFDFAEDFFKVNCIDMLVNNAGINPTYGWKKCMDVNIIGVMIGTHIAFDRMKKTKGAIINTASIAGLITGSGLKTASYHVSKHAVVALTRSLAGKQKNVIPI